MLRGIAEGRVRVPDGHKTDKLDKICLLCKTQFLVYPSESHRRYCSKKCASDDSASYRHNMGGYREGSGRRKSGYYKGLYCQSTYELCWAIYSLDHGVQFSRFPFMLESDTVKYFPDFLLADGKTIVELKGYEHTDAVARKTELAESLGYCVTVLRKDDLKIHFQYVKDTYGTSDFYTLYDGYKPKYDYVCDFCHEPFAVEKKRKALKVYCSNSCAGKAVGHRAQNTPLGSPTAVQ